MPWLRYGLPIAIVVGGLIAIVLSGGGTVAWEGGAGVVGAGLSVWLLNWLHRVGVAGDVERDAEQQARDYFGAHGVWPDDEPPASTPDA